MESITTNWEDTIRILHVDDEPELTELTSTFLRRQDDRFSIETVHSAREALEYLPEHSVDIVLSDYDMPDRNGIELLETVREDYPDLPFILYTGKGSEEIASDAISAGVSDYLQKSSGTDHYSILANRIANLIAQTRAVKEANRTKEYFSQILQHSSDYVMIVGQNGNVRYISPSVERVLGYTSEELDGEDAFQTIHPEDLSLAAEAFIDILDDPDAERTVEYRARHADGSWRWLEVRGRNLIDDSVIDGVLVTVRDISERKQQSRQLATLISNLPGIVYRSRNDPDWPLELVRGECEELTGYSADVLKEGDVSWGEDIIHPDDKARVWDTVQEAVTDNRPFEVTYRIQTDDGARKWVWERGRIIDTGPTDEPFLEGFITDITPRKEREEELARIERRYESIFNDPNILVGLIDTDGTVIDINQTAMQYIDATRGAVMDQPFWETPWFDHSEQVREEVRDWIERAAGGEYVKFQADRVRPNGEAYTVEGVFRPVKDDDGDVVSLLITSRDITERESREQELERMHDFFTEAERLGNLGAWEVSATGDVVWTDGTRRIHEVDEAYEPTIEDGIEFYHPDDRATIEQAVEAAMEGGESYDVVARLITANGNERWIRTRGKPIDDGDLIRGYIQDITEQKERELELDRQLDLFQKAEDIANVGAWEYDIRREEGWWSDEASRIHGLSPDTSPTPELSFQYYHPDDRPLIQDAFEQALEEGEPYDLELRLIDATDELKWVRTRGEPHYENGEPVLIRGTIQDITDRRRHEQQLTEIQQRTQSLMHTQTKEATAQVAVDTAHEVVDAPLCGVHLLSDDEQTLEPVALIDTVREELDSEPVYAESSDVPTSKTVWNTFETGEVTVIDEIAEHDQLSEATPARSVVLHPLSEHGVFIVSAIEPYAFNESEKTLLEILANVLTTALDRVDREQELTQKNEQLNQFASIVSHDIRNPLNVVKGRLELARKTSDSEDLEQASHALDRSFSLIDDLLSMARANETSIELEPLDLSATVSRCWDTVATIDATLTIEADQGIHADSSQLKQLLENLIRNAVEHGGDDVTVTVGDLPNGFYVADDGSGIPPEERQSVFETGYSTIQDGTGFGLNIVQEVVDAHGWEITVTESPEGGAQFEITGVDIID